jgi:hypothetical protein
MHVPKISTHVERARLRNRTKTESLIRCFDSSILWGCTGCIRSERLKSFKRWTEGKFPTLQLCSSELLGGENIGRPKAVLEFPGLRRFPDAISADGGSILWIQQALWVHQPSFQFVTYGRFLANETQVKWNATRTRQGIGICILISHRL